MSFTCPWCRSNLRYLIEEAEFIRPFRLYPDGRRTRAGPYEEGESIFRCPKCDYTSDIFDLFKGFTSYRRDSAETVGQGWAIFPMPINREEAEVCVIDFCTSHMSVIKMVREKGGPAWLRARERTRRIVNVSTYIMRYPIRTVLTLETEVGEDVNLQEIGGLTEAVMAMRRIGRIRVTKFREEGKVREVEIVARRGTVRIVEGIQEMRARMKRVWREGEVDEKQRSYERLLMEIVPVTEVREG